MVLGRFGKETGGLPLLKGNYVETGPIVCSRTGLLSPSLVLI